MKPKSMLKVVSALISAAIGINAASFSSWTTYAITEPTATTIATVQANEASASLKWGDVNSDGIIDNTDAELVLSVKLADHPQADVNADGILDQTDSDMIESFISGEIGYFPVGSVYDEKASFVTRGEWIHALVSGFSMSASEDSEITEYYTDLADYEYGSEITLAANFGVFDVLGTEFHPNAFVTRDFAAHTMNFCLGYPNDVTITFQDADAVYYDGDAQVALDRGWFKTENNEFCPSLYVTVSESELAFADMEEAVASSVIDSEHENTVKYADGVVQITDAESITMTGDEVAITGSSISLDDDAVIAFEIDGIEYVKKVVGYSWIRDDAIGLKVEDAEEESVTDCNIEGYAQIDYDNIEVLYESAAFSIGDKVLMYRPPEYASKSVDKTATTKKSIDDVIYFGSVGFHITGSLDNITVPYSLEKKHGKIERFYLGIDGDLAVSGKLEGALSTTVDNKVDVLNIPVFGAAGFSANLVLSVIASISGELELSYSCNMSAGVEYSKSGGWRGIKEFSNKKLHVNANATEKLGVRFAASAKFLKHELASLYVGLGEKGSFSTVSDSTAPVTCTHFSAHMYLEMGYNVDLVLIKSSKSWQIFDQSNSPLWIDLHWENGKLVSECTQGLGYNSKTNAAGGGSNGGGASGGYSKGSGYSNGYYGGTHGSGWLSKYYQSTMAFRELDPALVVSEDRILTDDLEVETDLIIRAKLDLNGHKLTAKRNVTIEDSWETNGTLALNKGTAVIEGNLSSDASNCVEMINKDDRLTVNGSVSLKGGANFSAGTTELKGDILGDYISCSGMHILVLSGTGNQNISGAGVHANVLDINNSDSRTITVDSTLSAESSTTIDGTSLHLICNQSRNDGSYVNLTKLNGDKFVIDGNVTLGTLDYRGKEFTINGDLLGAESISLNKTNMTINGDADTGDVSFNNSTISISGDYNHGGNLNMLNRNDKLIVGGDLHLTGTRESIQDGIIDVKGDVRLSYIDGVIWTTWTELCGNNKVILSGDKDVTIYTDPCTYFHDIEFLNSDKRTLYTDSTFKASSIDCGANPLNIITRGGSLSLGTVTCSDFKVKGDCSIQDSSFKCDTITFDGDAVFGGTLDFKGKPVSVKGLLTLNCDWNMNGGKLSAEDIILSGGSLSLGKGTIEASGDMTINGGKLKMEDDREKLLIKGDLTITNYPGTFTAGTIQCAGDISVTGEDITIRTGGDFNFVLVGESDQYIYIANSDEEWEWDEGETYTFTNLHVVNAQKRSLKWKGHLDVGNLTADADSVTIISDGVQIDDVIPSCNLKITGNVILNGIMNLNGKKIDISGDLYQHGGEISMNEGVLNITGNYMILQNEDAAVRTVSEGILNMTHDKDTVIVGGDFITMTKQNHSEYLTAGTLEIKGDFYQYDDGTVYAFPASGTHKVILSGSDKQKVKFESYDKSHFNNLALGQDKSNYEFSQDPCWAELVNYEAPSSGDKVSGDVNGDDSVDLKDVTLMRRALAGWDVTLNETNADVNGDNSFDMKDVTILRRYLAGWDVTLA